MAGAPSAHGPRRVSPLVVPADGFSLELANPAQRFGAAAQEIASEHEAIPPARVVYSPPEIVELGKASMEVAHDDAPRRGSRSAE